MVASILLIAGAFSTWQLTEAVRYELERPVPHWADTAFEDLRDRLGDADEAVFLTDDLKTANGRIHTCQFAIIPVRLIVRHDWPSLFVEIDAGRWCIFDASSSASIDDAEARLRTWSEQEQRALTFHRLSPGLALFRSQSQLREEGH